MTRRIVIDREAAEEAEAQARYYFECAGEQVADRFVAELTAIYVGLAEDRFVGVNRPGIRFRLPIRRVLLHRYPFAVVFYVDDEVVHVIAVEALRKRPGYWSSRLRSR